MRIRVNPYLLFLFLCTTFLFGSLSAQFTTISGTVYDITARRPLEAVAVLSSSGRGTITDSTGRYLIVVKSTDSIWFSLIGKSTMKYAVDTIMNPEAFNIMIHLRATELPEVKIRNNYYRYDSTMNRQDYAKIFNFKKPTLGIVKDQGYNPGAAVGFDLQGIIDMFRFKRNASILALQKRLIEQEQEKYVNNRFSKQFVRKITKLPAPELDSFMVHYRPDYAQLQMMNDLELGYWIGKKFEQYKSARYNWRGALYRRREGN